MGYFLRLKNSSKNLQNIDIFVVMKEMQKRMKEGELKIEQQRVEIDQLSKDRSNVSHRKENIDMNNYDPMVQAEMLT